MAETDGGAAPAAEESQRCGITINAQYIKDLSFENPRGAASLQQGPNPQLHIGVDINTTPLGSDQHEVVLHLQVRAQSAAGEPQFVCELAYGTMVTLHNVGEPDLQQALLVETPRMVFPFARAILADVTRDGGFTPVVLQPIDFGMLWRMRQTGGASGTA